MKCQCKLVTEIDGEEVRTCDGLGNLDVVRRRVESTQLAGKRLSRTPSSAQRPGKTVRALHEHARELDALKRLGADDGAV